MLRSDRSSSPLSKLSAFAGLIVAGSIFGFWLNNKRGEASLKERTADRLRARGQTGRTK